MLDKSRGMEWLRDDRQRRPDHQETVNAMTLAAFAKAETLAGKPLPEHLFQGWHCTACVDHQGVMGMTDMWRKVSHDERVYELNILKHEKLGQLLGMIDVVMLAEEFPDIFCITEKLQRLREARKDYDVACAAYSTRGWLRNDHHIPLAHQAPLHSRRGPTANGSTTHRTRRLDQHHRILEKGIDLAPSSATLTPQISSRRS